MYGRAVRVFSTDGRFAVGDRLGFARWVCRAGDEPTGPACIHYDDFKTASYMEAYLYGDPLECKLAAYEFNVIRAPSDEPTLTPRELEALLEQFGNARPDPLRMQGKQDGGGSGDVSAKPRGVSGPTVTPIVNGYLRHGLPAARVKTAAVRKSVSAARG